ncbi:hypothetical protein CYMTET_20028, partial [Cymbomonas tetramitiformis]
WLASSFDDTQWGPASVQVVAQQLCAKGRTEISQEYNAREAEDCKAVWLNGFGPHLRQDPWDREEAASLAALIQEHGAHDWEWLAERLAEQQLGVGSGGARAAEQQQEGHVGGRQTRSAFACLQYYRKYLDSSLITPKWTPEEDAALLKGVAVHGRNSWLNAAFEMHAELNPDGGMAAGGMERHKSEQCQSRYDKILRPEIRKGPWSLEDDVDLLTWQK